MTPNESMAVVQKNEDGDLKVTYRHIKAGITYAQLCDFIGLKKAERHRLNSKEGLSAMALRRRQLDEEIMELEILRRETFPINSQQTQ